MVSSRRFIDALTRDGFGPYTGVPCSFLSPFINYVIDRPDLEYLPATNEGEALAIASGAYLAGRRPVVMLQNSGLGNLVNPLASLNYIFRIPVLLIVTWRGEPGLRDEPQHELMGAITGDLLAVLRVHAEPFPAADADVEGTVARAIRHMEETGQPCALVMRKGAVDPYELASSPAPPGRPRACRVTPDAGPGDPPARFDAITVVAEAAGADALLVATTGKTGRELFTWRDRPTHFYMVGSMGCASSLALGVALYYRGPVVVLDGDGAALMRLEAMTSIGHASPPGLIHVILDNGAYESTGGQTTIAASVDFPGIAAACGYASASAVSSLDALDGAVRRALAAPGPHLVHARVRSGSLPNLGRPTVRPHEVAARFRSQVRALAAV